MSGSIIGFVIWSLMGAMCIGLGISSLFSKKATGFWANAAWSVERLIEVWKQIVEIE